MIRRRKQHAFTLVEVLLALGLTAILASMMFGLYHASAKNRRLVQDELEELRVMRMVMNQICRDLTSAVALKKINVGMSGQPDAAEWVCIDLPARRAWAEAQLGEQKPTPEADLRMVGYRLRVEEATGDELVVGIERTLERIVTGESTSQPSRGEEGMGESSYEAATRRQEEQAAEADEDEAAEDRITVQLLSESIRYLRLRYFDGQEWLDEWEDTASIPVAVEVSLGFKPALVALLEADDDYPHEVFRRVVYLPANANTAPAGTQTTGLGGTR
ncbi:MAG: prepilin-type N-terminal cleavage/methylation domain-containing protein [Phycisphaerales bacterium]|jgi:prepilin-type N-terminal cleavage/methylation domain-containing protein|nr:prepilin-type N-terminal cleavage/methylation domain-containing protein [Phycisphaerales bacterium]MBT7170852.1 prepilin-type N-terminal cleavage/methylation domain-containing protein [Phycisphaerales bacterium]